MGDPHHLQRFVDAQVVVFDDVVGELAAGRKLGHWVWFVFPQIDGLGRSSTARHFAIASMDEARAYLAHPGLNERVRHCTDLVNAVLGRSASEIFGSPDDMKIPLEHDAVCTGVGWGSPLRRGPGAVFWGGRQNPATLTIVGAN